MQDMEIQKMPVYDFKCEACDSVVEMRMATSEDPVPTCNQCGGLMTKVWTPPAVIFRGGGWGGQ